MEDFIATYSMFIVLMTTGVVVWIVGQIVKRNIPRKINKTYGYRTKRSMRSKEAWDFAQVYSTELLIQSSIIMIFSSVLSLFVKLGETTGSLVGTAFIILILFYPFIKTEQVLKTKFGDQ